MQRRLVIALAWERQVQPALSNWVLPALDLQAMLVLRLVARSLKVMSRDVLAENDDGIDVLGCYGLAVSSFAGVSHAQNDKSDIRTHSGIYLSERSSIDCIARQSDQVSPMRASQPV